MLNFDQIFQFYCVFQEFHRLQEENIQLKTICEDQEKALEELGSKLSEYVNAHKRLKPDELLVYPKIT